MSSLIRASGGSARNGPQQTSPGSTRLPRGQLWETVGDGRAGGPCSRPGKAILGRVWGARGRGRHKVRAFRRSAQDSTLSRTWDEQACSSLGNEADDAARPKRDPLEPAHCLLAACSLPVRCPTGDPSDTNVEGRGGAPNTRHRAPSEGNDAVPTTPGRADQSQPRYHDSVSPAATLPVDPSARRAPAAHGAFHGATGP